MFALSNFTMNLSSYTLSEAQISVLDKGLTFIPSTAIFLTHESWNAKIVIYGALSCGIIFIKNPSENITPMHSRIFSNRQAILSQQQIS